ncbi:glycosyltransferase [Stenotrophomonas sp. TWI587]|uniref:glycosyltransferase n=1 Tax=Stenotrophomonas sp. TWI587 TaxID=3136783 RepID=UPI00320B1E35
MKTIIHIVEATATGTLSMVCVCANLLASQGHTVHVIYSPRAETPDNLGTLFHSSIQLHRVEMAGKSIMAAFVHVRRLLRKTNPDIVHLHSSFAGFIGRIASIGLAGPTRLFYSPHCISVMREDIRYKKYVFALLERVASIKSCTYLACSNSERVAIRKWVGVEAVLLENAVDFADCAASPGLGMNLAASEPLTVVSVGGIRPQKDPALLAEIARGCFSAGLNIRFVWAGDGDPETASVLIHSGVEVTGWLEKKDVHDLLSRSSVYISTARWEGLPVSVIEAMASGMLVMATRCAGNVDAVEHGRTGLLFNTAEEAVELLACLSTGRLDPAAMIEAGTQEAGTRFSLQQFSKRLAAAYGTTSSLTTQIIY